MKERDFFAGYHPAVNILFFGLVTGFSMFVMNPVTLAISFVSALAYSLYVDGRKTFSFCVRFVVPMMTATALINPMFSHQGMTIIKYLPSGNPLTLESIIYGISSAVMLGSVTMWFRSYSRIMTEEKSGWLFGRITPTLSLLLSMILRFVPKFTEQFREVKEARSCIGERNAFSAVSIMVTWSLENAIETADSMKSRGYGLKGRTSYSIYRFGSRDGAALIWLASCGFFLMCGIISGGFKWRFYPLCKGTFPPLSFALFAAFGLLCLTPLIIDIKEAKSWKSSKSET